MLGAYHVENGTFRKRAAESSFWILLAVFPRMSPPKFLKSVNLYAFIVVSALLFGPQHIYILISRFLSNRELLQL
jgi:hypothetical protein